jgi:phage tail protein X
MSRFSMSSRYHVVPTAEMTLPDGRTAVYLKRRFVPDPSRFGSLVEHRVSDGDRLDLIAYGYFGDPESFWAICDANGTLHPSELTDAVGSRIRIPLPEGIVEPEDG